MSNKIITSDENNFKDVEWSRVDGRWRLMVRLEGGPSVLLR